MNKRKRNLIKKAHELAVYFNLKVTLLIKDDRLNTLQEFDSHADFTSKSARQWKEDHQGMLLDTEIYSQLPRKNYPTKNFIEQTLMEDYRKWFKSYQRPE